MENPLLDALFDADGAPLDPMPFDRVKAEHVGPALDALLERARKAVAAVASSSAPPTYDDTLAALDRATEHLETASSIVEHLESTATTPELRAAWTEAQPAVSQFWSELPLDPALYARLTAFEGTAEARALTGPSRRHLDKLLEEFRRHGAGLDDAGKRALTEVDVELGKLTTKFAQNVLDATNAFDLVVEEEGRLAGLPEFARKAARQSAESKGLAGYRFTLHAPSFIPAITYLDDAELREKLYRAYNERASSGPFDNRRLIGDILRLRRKKAQILGFADFADLTTADRMAGSGVAVRAFLGDLRAKTVSAFSAEKEALTRFAGKPLAAWDVAYWSEKQRRALYDFDEEAVRAYFPLDRTLDGLFAILKSLYGVTFEPVGAPVWDPAVRPYVLRDESGRLLARVYVDLFPRENKVQGAWMAPLRSGTPGRPHVAVVAANFSPPIGDSPSLLSHREVQTLFHEFGHLMHQCLSAVPVRRLSGTSVAWDFVELPSQIHENWVWERLAVDRVARHHESGDRLPDELFDRLRRARVYRAASAQMQQLGYAEVDLELHTRFDPESGEDPVDRARALLAEHVTAELPTSFAMIASFGHLFANPVGYAAGYYSYKWAEVLDADAFSRFAREGLLNREVGRAFADLVLSRGNSDAPEALFRAFMGRDARVDALLERQGLGAAPP